jgi:hypothetical protein
MRIQDQKWQIKAKATWLHFGWKIKLVWTPEKTAQMRAHDLENQDASSWVQLKDSICFKRVEIGS